MRMTVQKIKNSNSYKNTTGVTGAGVFGLFSSLSSDSNSVRVPKVRADYNDQPMNVWTTYNALTNNTPAQAKAAAGAQTRFYLKNIEISNTSASTAVDVIILSASTELARFTVPGNSFNSFNCDGLKTNVNEDLNVNLSGSVNTKISIQGYTQSL